MMGFPLSRVWLREVGLESLRTTVPGAGGFNELGRASMTRVVMNRDVAA